MPLASSGQISFNDIATEMGGSAPHGINEYYGGGGNIPSSGEITAADFHGASGLGKSYLGSNFTLTGAPSATFSTGTAATNRIIVVFALAYGASSQDIGFTGATIGGVTATFAGSTLTSGVDGCRLAGFYAAVPTGTSATVTTTCSGGTPADSGLVAYSVTGATYTAVEDYDGTGTVTVSRNVSANQILLGCASGNNLSSSGTWTGLTQDVSGDIRSNEYMIAGSHLTTAAESPRTITNNYTSSSSDDRLGKLLVFG